MDEKFWLFKSEPETYSFSDLEREQETLWNGIRNYQARNFLKEINPGDEILIYHSGKSPEIIGTARAMQKAIPDVDPNRPGEWFQIPIRVGRRLSQPYSLTRIKSNPLLAQMLLIKQSRLSVMPLTREEFKIITQQSELISHH